MPYRRLPNTDAARMRALQVARKQYELKGAENVPYSSKIVHEISAFIPFFERAIAEYKTSVETQFAKNQKYQNKVRMVRMYISHFIQVLNLSCQRNEIKPEKKLLYKLLPDNYSVPDLSTEMLLIEWGKNIIDGESERTRSGGAPIYNPAISKVSVHYDQFCDSFQTKKVLKKNTDRYLESVQKLRIQADALILNLWDQIEKSYAELGTEEMQNRAKEFGIVYYLRRKERQALGLPVSGDEDK